MLIKRFLSEATSSMTFSYHKKINKEPSNISGSGRAKQTCLGPLGSKVVLLLLLTGHSTSRLDWSPELSVN